MELHICCSCTTLAYLTISISKSISYTNQILIFDPGPNSVPNHNPKNILKSNCNPKPIRIPLTIKMKPGAILSVTIVGYMSIHNFLFV